METLLDFAAGALTLGFLIVGLFFLRFWRSTGDRFFLFFALSFFIEALSRVFLAPVAQSTDDAPMYYLIRLLSYALIVFAILDKNRPRNKRRK